MDTLDSRTEQLLAEMEEEFFDCQAKGRRLSRRELIRCGSGTAVVSAIGVGGLMELLANREAFAAGTLVVGLVGVTREPDEEEETPHRHGFVATFVSSSVSSEEIKGRVSGRTVTTFSTTSKLEEAHFHIIQGSVSLEHLILSGPENNMNGEHAHFVSIE